MSEKIIQLLTKYKSFIMYVVFGILTTFVNVITYYIFAHIFSFGTVSSSVVAWFVAVSFAYITNRKWVFESKSNAALEIFGEILKFFSCRLATGAVDWAIMYIFVDLLLFNDLIIKIIANIVVIVLNYVASLFVVFNSKK